MFFPSNALSLALFLYMPTLDSEVSCEYRDLPQPIRIPGCNIQVYAKHFPVPSQDRQSILYQMHLEDVTKYRMAKGIIVNTFHEMEAGAIEFLKEKRLSNPPVFPVGPLVQTDFLYSITRSTGQANEDTKFIMKWLDHQTCNSILYICFGSSGSLSPAQLHELAFGLDMSRISFLWVVQIPNENSNSTSTRPDHHDDGQSFSCLPHGFVERAKGRGLLVSSWAPQAQILSHDSTGGFLTHCGWNSVLESVVNGVPMMAWPLCAEQHMNAEMLGEDLKISLRPRANNNSDTDQDGLVGRVEIANAVKNLMEGEEGQELRRRIRDLKDAAEKALREDGSSSESMSELASQWISIRSSRASLA